MSASFGNSHDLELPGSISLFLELAGSNLAQTLLNPSKNCMALVIFVPYACKCQTAIFNKNKRYHINFEGLGSVRAKLEPASSKDNEMLKINVLQKFTSMLFTRPYHSKSLKNGKMGTAI